MGAAAAGRIFPTGGGAPAGPGSAPRPEPGSGAAAGASPLAGANGRAPPAGRNTSAAPAGARPYPAGAFPATVPSALGRTVSPSSNPAAMTVTRTSSPSASSITAPKMMLASSAAELETSCAASWISNRPRSDPPWMDSSTPWAPSMLASSSGLEIAFSAAATARSSPRAEPMPMSAEPAPDMTDLTSAKSRLIRPGVVIRSVMPWTPDSSTWSAALNASRTLTCRSEMDSSRSFGITISVSTSLRSVSMPASA